MSKFRTDLQDLHRPRWLLTIALVAAFLYAAGGVIPLGISRLLVKPIPVLCLAACVLLRRKRSRYETTVGIGLLFGALGDLLMESPDQTFIPGLASFLIGHLLYIGAFLSRSRRPCIVRAVPIYLVGLIILFPLLGSPNVQTQNLEIPILCYMIVICGMVWRAWSVLDHCDYQSASRLALAGALLFLVSDSVLAVQLFLHDIPFARVTIMTTYWLGQLGIASSAVPQDRSNC